MKKIILPIFTLLLFAFNSCSDSDSEKNKNVNISFYLTDAPAIESYKAVHLDIQSISYSLGDDNWIALTTHPTLIELLQFSNGKGSLLSNVTLEAGIKVKQIRLKLGDNNSVTLSNGNIVPLKVPSGQASGFKINIQSAPEVTSGYRVIIDFDASKSIVSKGNSSYSLKPVIRAYIEANTSAIYGNIIPSNQITRVFVINTAGDTISTLSDTLQNNYFKLHGLFSDTYDLEIQNLITGEIFGINNNLNIVGGTDINLGIISIPDTE